MTSIVAIRSEPPSSDERATHPVALSVEFAGRFLDAATPQASA